MFARNIAIDLGTASIIIYVEGKGIVLNEPSVVAFETGSRRLVAAGKKALDMIGRAPDSITVAHPLMKGVISDYTVTEQMLRYFLSKVYRYNIFKPKMVVCVPSVVTTVEKRTVADVCRAAGARKVALIEEPIAAAIGGGVDISKPHGTMVVDIGGGTTDIAVLTLGSMAVTRSLKVAGNSCDEAIIRYVRKHYSILIGELTAERIKREIGCVFPQKEIQSIEAKGRNYITGLPNTFEINSKQVFQAMEEPLLAITEGVQEVLERTPPELVGDIVQDGILMTGGGSLLRGLDQLITYKTGVKTRVAEDAVNCVVLGAGESLKHLESLSDGTEVYSVRDSYQIANDQ